MIRQIYGHVGETYGASSFDQEAGEALEQLSAPWRGGAARSTTRADALPGREMAGEASRSAKALLSGAVEVKGPTGTKPHAAERWGPCLLVSPFSDNAVEKVIRWGTASNEDMLCVRQGLTGDQVILVEDDPQASEAKRHEI